jgi:probable HAF family extracellular repeat protein
MIDLGTLGGRFSDGFAINNSRQVVGSSETSSGEQRPFLYSNGQMIDLGTLGGNDSAAEAINDAGQVVGFSGTFNATSAFLYSNGQMTNLNDLIDPALGIMLSGAGGINNSGQIVATSYTQVGSLTTYRAYLLTPIPDQLPGHSSACPCSRCWSGHAAIKPRSAIGKRSAPPGRGTEKDRQALISDVPEAN